jgi:hypothetical protein
MKSFIASYEENFFNGLASTEVISFGKHCREATMTPINNIKINILVIALFIKVYLHL